MKRKLLVAITAATLLLAPATALAHGSSDNAIAHEETIMVGPYKVRVGFNEWPLKAKKSVEFTIHPEGGIDGKDGFILVPHDHGPFRDHLEKWPGVDDAWVFQMQGFHEPGPTTVSVEISDGKSTYTGQTAKFMVADPPNVPEWGGWAIGLTPLYGIVWFGFREKKRIRAAALADGGARI